MSHECPFQPGDRVIYMPPGRLHEDNVLIDHEAGYEAGKEYRIRRVEDGQYVVAEGLERQPAQWWEYFKPKVRP